jgi:glutathione reductase (NADPH)
MADKGIRTQSMTINWPEFIRFKGTETEPVPTFFAQSFAKASIDAAHGRARFVGPTTVAVRDDLLTGKYVLIAAGATPAAFPFPGMG